MRQIQVSDALRVDLQQTVVGQQIGIVARHWQVRILELLAPVVDRRTPKFIECEQETQRKSKRPIEHFDAIFCSSLL